VQIAIIWIKAERNMMKHIVVLDMVVILIVKAREYRNQNIFAVR
jgi:hypothetical protein